MAPPPVSPRPSPQPGVPIPPGADSLLPLTTLVGRYVILEKIGAGGMAVVYKAQDKKSNQIVAIKEMSESDIRRKNPNEWEEILMAFEREAQLLASLSHPNLVRVSDAFRDGERHYMVMEFVPGRTLEAMLEEQLEPFPEDRVLVWAAQLCDVLAYLHSQSPKIIYRDLKPGNVMVLEETDRVKLLDMGIARTYKPGKQKDTITLGTPGYAPPEQYGKGQTDERSDIYTLGALLHYLLSLGIPSQHTLEDFPPLRSLNPKVSPHVANAIARAVQKERSKRFASAQELKEALLGEEEVAPKPVRIPAKKKPAPPTKPLQVSPPALDWGLVIHGTPIPPKSLTVSHPAGAKVSVQSSVHWLGTHLNPIDDETTEVVVLPNSYLLPLGRRSLSDGCLLSWVGWHTARLVPESRLLAESVTIELNDGQSQSVPVTLIAAPSWGQVGFGWFITILLLLTEIAFALFCIAVLLSGFGGS